MIINISHGAPIYKGLPKIDYTGEYELLDEGDGNWKAVFKTSGDLTFRKVGSAKHIDIFAVGGGQNGIEGESGGGLNPGHPGRGGNGGEGKTVKGFTLKGSKLNVKIGGNVDFYRPDKEFGTTLLKSGEAEIISVLPALRYEVNGTPEFDEPGGKEYGKRGSFGTGGDAKVPGDGGNGGTAGWNSSGPGGKGAPGILIIRNAR